MSSLRTILVLWAVGAAAAISVGLAFGYAIEAGSRLTPTRLKLAEAFDRSERTSDRLIGTLNDMINMNCTWGSP